jgi:phosphatidylinositol glycan class V
MGGGSVERRRHGEVLRVAAGSRALVLAWAALSRRVVGAYDSSAALLSAEGGAAARWAPPALGANWDAAYFLRIAQHGYEYEQFHAFFPLTPALARLVGEWLLWPISPCPQWRVATGGVLSSNLCTALAAVVLYELGLRTFAGREELAFRAAVLFCFSPASVFLSAFYSEAPYALLSFCGMAVLQPPQPPPLRQQLKEREQELEEGVSAWWRLWAAAPWFALATLARANGALLAGFVCYGALFPLFARAFRSRSALALAAPRELVWAALRAAGPAALAVAPLGAYLAAAYAQYCTGAGAGSPATARPWCSAALPNVYVFVQEAYWDNGLLRYYQAKQVPNFVLAAPSALLCAGAVRRWAREPRTLAHALHLAALLSGCALLMHVQVLTRFVSACPCLYWYVAEQLAGEVRWPVKYAALYVLLGPAMFACYYPWS